MHYLILWVLAEVFLVKQTIKLYQYSQHWINQRKFKQDKNNQRYHRYRIRDIGKEDSFYPYRDVLLDKQVICLQKPVLTGRWQLLKECYILWKDEPIGNNKPITFYNVHVEKLCQC